MRILVIGAGAIGGYFGGRLLQAGRDVTFLVRPRRAEQLAATGLLIKSSRGDLVLERPPTVQAADLKEPFDLILLSCKAYDLAGAIDAFAPAVGPRSAILPLLNGMRHLDTLDERFGRDRVLGGKCVISVTLDDAGAVLHLNPAHSLTFGERAGGFSERVREIAAMLGDAGFDLEASEHIEQDMWEKWLFLATLAAATCLMRAPIGAIVAAPGGRELMLGLLDETCAIAAAHGHAPRAPYLEQIRAVLVTPGSPITASMMRDIERNAPIEADQIVGDLIRRRGGAGQPPALLDIAHTHLKAYEARRG